MRLFLTQGTAEMQPSLTGLTGRAKAWSEETWSKVVVAGRDVDSDLATVANGAGTVVVGCSGVETRGMLMPDKQIQVGHFSDLVTTTRTSTHFACAT